LELVVFCDAYDDIATIGLSTRVRDTMLGTDALPHGDANRKWALRVAEDKISKSGKSLVDYNRIESVAKETLKKLSRGGADPYPVNQGMRHIPGVCSLWMKGKCQKGKDCPYRYVENGELFAKLMW
jgi:pre-mRNA-splicing factor RBM22/SLT11